MRSSPFAADPLDPGPAGFAHRGLHGQSIPENSMAAFRAAAAIGAGIECDVRLSFDGVPMLFHDADLKRLCGSSDRVIDHDSGSLGARRLSGSGETIPCLTDLLAFAAHRVPLLLELKVDDERAVERLANAVGDALLDSRADAGVMSFEPAVGAWFAEQMPAMRRGLVVSSRWSAARRRQALDRARAQFLAIDRRLAREQWVARCRDKMPVYCWTIRTPAERETAAIHADALIWEADGRP